MLELSYPQHVYLNELNTPFKAYVGGYGSGKTFVGSLDLCHFAGTNPRIKMAYYAPTYAMMRDIFYPTIEEAAFTRGFRAKVSVSHKEVDLYKGKKYYSTIICRSMDNPDSIIGYKTGRALVDELDLIKMDKAQRVWNKIIARNRLKFDGQNTIGVTTTPEGFGFVYKKFKEAPTESYSMVQASTYENEHNLSSEYIKVLEETYSAELFKAYVNGEFVNLTSGTIYTNFDRVLSNCNDVEDGKEPLFIGMDFNVNNMSGSIFVKRPGEIRNDEPRLVDEIVKVFDTPAMIRTIKERFCKYHGRSINVFPDASGDSRKSVNASQTDKTLLEQAGFRVWVEGSNPRVKDRINSVQSAFLNAKGERLLKVNCARCPQHVVNLEQQTYDDSGEPDKKKGNDHTNDSVGYFVAPTYPLLKPVTSLNVRW